MLAAAYRRLKKLSARLVAFRVPPKEAEKRRGRLRAKAAKTGRPPSAARLELCAWNVFVTNLPPFRRTHELDEVRAFFGHEPGSRTEP